MRRHTDQTQAPPAELTSTAHLVYFRTSEISEDEAVEAQRTRHRSGGERRSRGEDNAPVSQRCPLQFSVLCQVRAGRYGLKLILQYILVIAQYTMYIQHYFQVST